MIEVCHLIVPLDGQFLLIRIKQSLVDWFYILPSTHTLNKFLGLVSNVVSEFDAEWEPSLFDLWIRCVGHIVVSVNFTHDLEVHLTHLRDQLFQENNVQATVPVIVLFIVFWALARVINVIRGQLLSFKEIWRGKVQLIRCKSWLSDPGSPVHHTNFLGSCSCIISCITEFFEMVLESSVVLRRLTVIFDPILDHCLEICLIKNLFLEIIEKLEALLIGNLRERVVWFIILNNWVQRRVTVVESIL